MFLNAAQKPRGDDMDDTGMADGTKPTVEWQVLAQPIAVLPVGAFEQHGPHLPLATDTIKAEYFARRLAKALGAALLPALPIAQSLEHSGFRGSISLRPDTFMAVIRDIVAELEQQHLTRVVIVNGHGGNWSLAPTVREINRSDRPAKVILANYWECDKSDVGRELRTGEVHAGAWETSLMLAIAPDLVGAYEDVTPGLTKDDVRQSDLNHVGIGALSPTGVWGDPRGASAEAGRVIAESIAENLVRFVSERLDWFDKDDSYAGAGPVVIRPMVSADIDAGLRLSRSAGWNQRRNDWAFFFEAGQGKAFVAVRNGEVVGTVTTMTYEGGLGWIGMVLVDEAMRRRGIATRLVESAVEALSACRCIKLDATPEGKAVYDRLGFEAESTLGRMVVPVAPRLRESSSNVRPMQDSDVDAVVQLDAAAFGAERLLVVDRFRALAPEFAFVGEDDAGGLTGFSLGRHGDRFEQIGPLIAVDIDGARALLAATAANAEGKPMALDVPHHDEAWGHWLSSHGFVEQRMFVRMRRGTSIHADRPECTFAVSGPELG
jgi:creatinine amidohydrolase